MLKLHEFYRKFDDIPKEDRFNLVETPGKPTSLFVIFQRLGQVAAQKRYYEEEERHLLNQAEDILNKKQ